jgi:hypothetical protein
MRSKEEMNKAEADEAVVVFNAKETWKEQRAYHDRFLGCKTTEKQDDFRTKTKIIRDNQGTGMVGMEADQTRW